MKKFLLLSISVVFLFAFVGCDLTTGTADDRALESEPRSFKVEVGGIPDAASRSISTDATVTKVYVKVLSSVRATLTPTVPSATETMATELTKTNGTWRGSVSVTGASGSVTLVAYGTNDAGQHLYAGYGASSDAGGSVTITASPAASGGYIVGGTAANNFGPGGGFVFYNDTTNKLFYEAAPADVGANVIWSTNESVTSATGTAIGTGNSNTTLIADNVAAGASAADTVKALTTSGYSNWFLPSSDEISQIYTNIRDIGSFTAGVYYWTSTEVDSINATQRIVSTNASRSGDKNAANRKALLRAVRTFPYGP